MVAFFLSLLPARLWFGGELAGYPGIMAREVQTVHFIQGQLICGLGEPTSPTAENGRLEGLSRLIMVDPGWLAACLSGPQEHNGVTSHYEFNAPADEHLLHLDASGTRYTYRLVPAQFAAANGGYPFWLGLAVSPNLSPLPNTQTFSFRKDMTDYEC